MLILLFSYRSFAKLLESLEEEYKVRTPYLAYLVNAHQGLLATHAHLERLIERVERYIDIVLWTMLPLQQKILLNIVLQ